MNEDRPSTFKPWCDKAFAAACPNNTISYDLLAHTSVVFDIFFQIRHTVHTYLRCRTFTAAIMHSAIYFFRHYVFLLDNNY